ncbi:MAG TPA: universal stress protein [Pirellulales bacterium]|nr:universal stress protein [Pirellulales bacterium]
MISRILVPLGGGTSLLPTIQQAIELARLHGAELTAAALFDAPRLWSVGPVPVGGTTSAIQLRQYRTRAAKQSLDEAVAEFETAAAVAGVPHHVVREEGDPIDRLVNLSRYHDVVVAGLDGLFEWELVDEPPDELVNLVRDGVRPLVAVNGHARSIHRVMIAYSGSVESARTMRQFIQLRLWSDVRIKLVTFNERVSDGERILADAAEYCRSHGYQPEIEVSPFAPRWHLLRYAQAWDADMLVLGNSARSLLLRRWFGETALEVIRHAELPLFLSQ